jgi:hypothetical protein
LAIVIWHLIERAGDPGDGGGVDAVLAEIVQRLEVRSRLRNWFHLVV